MPSVSECGAESGAKLERLKKYQEQLPHYRPLLRSPSPLRIHREKIPEYVAQHKLEDSQQRYHNYLAVREVRIFCPFPHDNVSQIAVVDMPGLGDTGAGDEDRLIKALGRDIDFILFQRYPKTSGDYWQDVDVRLYDVAGRALQELPLREWSVQILNRDSTNRKNCDDLKNSIRDHHIDVAAVLTANCADDRDAAEQVLSPVLDYMSQHIARLDERYAQSKQVDLDRLQEACLNLVADIQKALGIQTGQGATLSGKDDRVFSKLFDSFWTDITQEISDLVQDIRSPRGARLNDDNFNKGLAEAKRRAQEDTGIPDESGIEIEKNRNNFSYNKAFLHLLDIVRNTLTSHFQEMDVYLSDTVESAKARVVKALRAAGLANLSPKENSVFLNDLVELIAISDVPTLYRGFYDLAEFRLLYRGFVQHHIREHLDIMMPDHNEIEDFEKTAEGVREKLELVRGEALFAIEKALKELAWQPRMAVFAVIEEFNDRVFNAKGVKKEWEHFLRDHRDQIWKTHFAWQNVLNKLTLTVASDKLSLSSGG